MSDSRKIHSGVVGKAPKIGFFDSGVGGRTILSVFALKCPEVECEYLTDSEHFPYGNRESEEIFRLTERKVKELLRRGCTVIVIACNTATAAAIDRLRSKYPQIPFVGLEPAVKPAVLSTKSKVVGVLATAGTLNGRLYNATKARYAKGVTVIATVADELVIEVEKLGGKPVGSLPVSRRERLRQIIKRRLDPLLAAGADRIVLGCTHFPHLRPLIDEVCAPRAEVVDNSEAVVRQIIRVMK